MEDLTRLKLRALDLISMFDWHPEYVVPLCSQTPARYAVVSENVQAPDDHWIDGFVEDLSKAAELVAGLETEDWILAGVFDLSGEPGTPLSRVPARIRYEVGDLDGEVASTDDSLGVTIASLNDVGFSDSSWARLPLGIED